MRKARQPSANSDEMIGCVFAWLTERADALYS